MHATPEVFGEAAALVFRTRDRVALNRQNIRHAGLFDLFQRSPEIPDPVCPAVVGVIGENIEHSTALDVLPPGTGGLEIGITGGDNPEFVGGHDQKLPGRRFEQGLKQVGRGLGFLPQILLPLQMVGFICLQRQ